MEKLFLNFFLCSNFKKKFANTPQQKVTNHHQIKGQTQSKKEQMFEIP